MARLGSLASRVTFKFQTPSRTFICCSLTMLFLRSALKEYPLKFHGQQWDGSCSSLLSTPVTARPPGVLDLVVSHVSGKTDVPLGKGYSEERSWKKPAWEQPLTNRKGEVEHWMLSWPMPCSRDIWISEPGRISPPQKEARLWWKRSACLNRPIRSRQSSWAVFGFAQSQMQSLSHSHKHDPR